MALPKVSTGRSGPRDDHGSGTLRPPNQIDVKAIISDKAVLMGTHNIVIGANSVLHPYAKLDSTSGPIVVGVNCIVAERVTISGGVTMGDNVTVDTRAAIEATHVGTGTIIGACTSLSATSSVGRFCKIGPAEQLQAQQELPDYTVFYGDGKQRLDTTVRDQGAVREARIKHQAMHIDVLRRLIPSNIAKWQT